MAYFKGKHFNFLKKASGVYMFKAFGVITYDIDYII